MKQVLIISPYFPPCNAADMQRVRMSLPYFAENGWEAEVVVVDPDYADINKDGLLMESLPAGIKIHKLKALNKKTTVKFGLGSIALRSIWYYRKKVSELLRSKKYDLIYFSTTQFPVCILGAYWKRRFHVPYVIDMQDPWHSDYYRDKPKVQQPSKYWFSYRFNKYAEPVALKNADGLISVSEKYITDLKERYPRISGIPAATITFGAFGPDMQIAERNKDNFANLLDKNTINVVYIGRGGIDMHQAIRPVFATLKNGLKAEKELFSKFRFYFIGTSYAPGGKGAETIMPLARQYGVEHHVTEVTARISYYHTLVTLQQADALFIPGSDDPRYTASKIYPYLLTFKPLLALFNKASSAIGILQAYGAPYAYDYDAVSTAEIRDFMAGLAAGTIGAQTYSGAAIAKYSASRMTFEQCRFFDQVAPAEVDSLIGKLRIIFGFIFNHPLGRRHPVKAFSRFLHWQLQSRSKPSAYIVKSFLPPVRFLARKGLTGITGNIYTGLHEFNDMGFLLHFLRPGDIFADVGANVGSYTLLASGICRARAIAVEPSAATVELLKENLALNGLLNDVTIINKAAGADERVLNFSTNEDTTNHVIVQDEGDDPAFESVRSTSLDALTADAQPALIKIDVEGYETEVLKGMSETLKQHPLKAIIIELDGNGARYGFNEHDIHVLLLAHKFKPYRYDPFRRELWEMASYGDHNTIYCRDMSFINGRLASAEAFKIMGESI